MLITRGDGLLSTAQAARMAHRREGTIRAWASTGRLPRRGLDERGRPLYHPDDVAAVEKEAHDAAMATSRRDTRKRNMAAA